MNKTEQMIKHFKNEDYKKALKISRSFDRIFNVDEIKIISRAYEMFSNENFYKSLGFNFNDQLTKAKQIIRNRYKF